jgi:hypothetical protein
MDNFLTKQNKTYFLPNQNWHQLTGVLVLISLSVLNLVWPLASLILLVSLVTLLCFLIRPYVALLLAALLLAFQSFNVHFILTYKFEIGISFCYIFAILGLLCWFISRLAKLSPPYQSTILDVPLLFFFVTHIISLLWTPYFRDGFRLIVTTGLCYVIYFLICALNNTPRDLKRLFWLFFAAGLLVVLTTFASFFIEIGGRSAIHRFTDSIYFSTFIYKFTGSRESLGGTIGNAKPIATMIDFALFCGLSLFCTQERRSSKVLIFLGLFVLLFVHFLTISRIETINIFLGWLTFVYLNPQWRNKRIKVHALMIATVSAVLLSLTLMLSMFYTTKYLFARFTAQEQTVGYRFSGTQNRYDLYMDALTEFWKTGGIGAGAGGIMRARVPNSEYLPDSASLYMGFLTDHGYGILSVILMLWIMLNIIIGLKRALENCPDVEYKIFIIGVLSAFVVFGNPICDVFYYIFIEWILLAFSAVIIKSIKYPNVVH